MKRFDWLGIVLAASLFVTGLGLSSEAQAQPAEPPAGDPPAADAKPADAAAGDAAKDAPAEGAAKDAPAEGAAEDAPAEGGAPADPAAPAADAPAEGGMDGATYAVRLRDLEQKIDELKEQIRRSHTRLSLLSDTILSGGGSGSRAVISFRNELSDAFRVTRALFVLDGAVQYNKQDQSGALAEQSKIPIYNGSIPPGDHTLQVLINLQGHGYGVFSYLRGYKFEVRSSHSFTAVEGKSTVLEVMAYEKGGVTTPLEERPAIRYNENVRTGLADASAAPAK